jgi:hypothetical protein
MLVIAISAKNFSKLEVARLIGLAKMKSNQVAECSRLRLNHWAWSRSATKWRMALTECP